MDFRGGLELRRWRTEWLSAFGALFGAWFLYLLAYWPGLMTSDSVDQWTQVHTGRFVDYHPALHTMSNWLVTRLWDSPAAVALLNIVGLAAATSFCVSELGRFGVSRRVRWAALALLAVSPACGLTVNTLWKDIPFTSLCTFLFGVSLALVRTRGEWLRARSHWAALVVLLALTPLMRKNGPGVIFAYGVVLLVLPWGPWFRKAALAAFGIAVAVAALVNGPLYKAFHIPEPGPFAAMNAQLHQLAAFAVAGEVPPEDVPYFETMQPMSLWRENYRCDSSVPLIYSGKFKSATVDQHPKWVFEHLWKLIQAHPRTFFAHELCATELLWRVPISQRAGPPGFLRTLDKEAVPTRPAVPLFTKLLDRWSRFSMRRIPSALFWTPALWMYLALLAVGAQMVRWRLPSLGLVLVPALANTLTLLLAMASPDFRYEFPMMFAGLLSLTLLAVRAPAAVAERSEPALQAPPSAPGSVEPAPSAEARARR